MERMLAVLVGGVVLLGAGYVVMKRLGPINLTGQGPAQTQPAGAGYVAVTPSLPPVAPQQSETSAVFTGITGLIAAGGNAATNIIGALGR